MAGLTDQGFVIKRLNDVVTDLRAKAIELFQDMTVPGDQVDVSDSALLGRLINTISPSLAELWEAAQQDYAAFDPNSATGIALDNLVAIGGLIRQGQSFSSAQVVLGGDIGVEIPISATVGSSVNTTQWSVFEPVIITASQAAGASFTPLVVADSTLYRITYAGITTTNNINYTSGAGATSASIIAGIASLVNSSHPSLKASVNGTTLTLMRVDPFSLVSFTTTVNLGITKGFKIGEVRANTPGAVEAEPNSLTSIMAPRLGWDSVYNPYPASLGRSLETDEELRLRFRETKFERASSTIDSIYSAIRNLNNIEEVVVYENDKDVADANGIPSHSFMPIVLGGSDEDIAQTIWDNKPMGIRSYGTTSVVIYDSQGFAHDVAFKRPTPIPVYITMTLVKDQTYPGSGNDDIRSALIQFFEDNFGIGDDVIYTRLYTPINSVPGHYVSNLRIGTSPTPTGTTNISIAYDQIATLASVNILIN